MPHCYDIPVTKHTFDCLCGCRMGQWMSWRPATGKPCTCPENPQGTHREGCPSEYQIDPFGECPVHDRGEPPMTHEGNEP